MHTMAKEKGTKKFDSTKTGDTVLVIDGQSIRWLCRSTSSSKFQKHQKCKDAGAVKPN